LHPGTGLIRQKPRDRPWHSTGQPVCLRQVVPPPPPRVAGGQVKGVEPPTLAQRPPDLLRAIRPGDVTGPGGGGATA
jgi:hypothetical protein